MKSKFSPVPPITQPFYEFVLNKVMQNHENNSEQLAMVSLNDRTQAVTWLELYNKAHYLASSLGEHGLHRGQICSIVLPNCWELVVAFFGTILTGGAATFPNIVYTEYEITNQLRESKSPIIITDSKRLRKVLAAASNVAAVKHVICVTRDSSSSLPGDVRSFEQATQQTAQLFRPDKSQFRPDDLLLLPFSSGSTGPSKGVLLTHESYGTALALFHKVSAEHMYPKAFGEYRPQDECHLVIRPVSHTYGLLVLLRALYEGTTSLFINKLELHSYCQAIQDYKIRQMFVVPSVVRELATDPEVESYDLSSLRLVVSSAEACGDEMASKLLERFPSIQFFGQAYGMTETSVTINIPLLEERKDMSTGVLSPNFEQKIVDLTTRAELPNGEAGEILLKGPMMKGYLNRPRSDVFDEDGWFHTGDVGYFDEKERLHIIDRIKHMIKVRGYTVSAVDLENVLLLHPKVKEAVVVGVKDAESQEHPMAFIIKKDESLSADEIHEFMKEKVAPQRQLTGGVEFRAAFPRAHSGKVLRRCLIE